MRVERLSKEELETFKAAREAFITANSQTEFRETMRALRLEHKSIPTARREFIAANPAG